MYKYRTKIENVALGVAAISFGLGIIVFLGVFEFKIDGFQKLLVGLSAILLSVFSMLFCIYCQKTRKDGDTYE